MNNISSSPEGKTKNITLGSVVAWIVGVLSGLSGIMLLVQGKIVVGLLYILIALIVLPPASKFVKQKMNFGLSRGLKITVVLILLVIAGTIMTQDGSSASLVTGSSSQPIATPQAPAQKPIVVSALKLSSDYKANQVAADAKYKNNVVQVSGIVNSIGKDILDNPYITLNGDAYGVDNVQCMFSKGDEAKLAQVSQGQSITLQGTVSGSVIVNVLVDSCTIVQ